MKVIALLLLLVVSIFLNFNPISQFEIQSTKADLSLNALAANFTSFRLNPSPPGRIHFGITYDSHQKKILIFGGNTNDADNDTWQFDVNEQVWSELHPLHSPPYINYHKMVYNPIIDASIMFGGYSGQSTEATLRQDTWLFNYTANSWINLNSTGPVGRRDPAMTYIDDTGLIVLFGGQGEQPSGGLDQLNDLWEYNATSNTWRELNPVNRPVARQDHKIVFDPINQILITFGGTTTGRATYANDTWVYSYAENKWIDMKPIVQPKPRRDFTMIYNNKINKVVLLGGGDGKSEFHDVWTYEYKTNSWQQLYSSPASYIMGTKGGYDTDTDTTVMYGGETNRPEDTWIMKFYDGPKFTTQEIHESSTIEKSYINYPLMVISLQICVLVRRKTYSTF